MAKKVYTKYTPKAQKKARSKYNPDNYMDKYIAWHFGKMDLNADSDWSWNLAFSLDHNNELFEKLCKYENMKLSEVQDRINHSVGLDSLNMKAIKELEKNHLDDIEKLYSFHIIATTRFYCIPMGNIMKLLWYDPYHNYNNKKAVCPPHR